MAEGFMDYEWRDMVARFHKEGDERTKKKIAKRLKGLNMFTDEFIASITELNIKTVKKLKAMEKGA